MSNIPQGKYENTIKECTKALELNPTYVKALVRRGEAHEKLEHFEEALAGEFKFHMRLRGCQTPLRFALITPDPAMELGNYTASLTLCFILALDCLPCLRNYTYLPYFM